MITYRNHKQEGFNLVEIMVAMTIGLVLVAGMGVLMLRQSVAREEMSKQSRQIESGRYANEILSDEIHHAGYYGQFSPTYPVPSVLPNPCSASPTSVDASLALPIQPYSALATIPTVSGTISDCLSDANHVPGTDIIVIRRAETVPTAIGNMIPGQLYLQSTSTSKIVGLGTPTAATNAATFSLTKKDGTTLADIAKLIISIYFVSPCNTYAASQSSCTASADNGTPVPTLKKIELGSASGDPAWVSSPLVDGIQRLHLDYGIDADNDGVSDSFTNSPALASMQNIMSVAVNILARNTNGSMGFTDDKTYGLGLSGAVGPFNDQFKRHVYTSLSRVTNVSQRRQQ